MILDEEVPTDTAGLRDPPEMFPIARPPAVTQEPIARPQYRDRGDLTVATESTTKQSAKVKIASPIRAAPQVYGALGPNAKFLP